MVRGFIRRWLGVEALELELHGENSHLVDMIDFLIDLSDETSDRLVKIEAERRAKKRG